jgi:hypothetical protein
MVIWHSVYTNSKPMIHISRFYPLIRARDDADDLCYGLVGVKHPLNLIGVGRLGQGQRE